MPPLFASGGHAFCPLLTRGSGPAPCFSLRRLTGATGLPTERRRHRDALASLPSSSSAPRRAAAVSHSAGQLLLGSTEGSGSGEGLSTRGTDGRPPLFPRLLGSGDADCCPSTRAANPLRPPRAGRGVRGPGLGRLGRLPQRRDREPERHYAAGLQARPVRETLPRHSASTPALLRRRVAPRGPPQAAARARGALPRRWLSGPLSEESHPENLPPEDGEGQQEDDRPRRS